MPHSRVAEPTHDDLLRIFAQPKTIAVVGASSTVGKPAHDIPAYLQSQGYRIVPVNPHFRPPGEAEAIARDAVIVGAKVIWFPVSGQDHIGGADSYLRRRLSASSDGG